MRTAAHMKKQNKNIVAWNIATTTVIRLIAEHLGKTVN